MSLAVPGKVISVQPYRSNLFGIVQFGETQRPVFLDLVPDAGVGDYVLVHVGFAVCRLGKEEAERASKELGNVAAGIASDEAGADMVRRSNH